MPEKHRIVRELMSELGIKAATAEALYNAGYRSVDEVRRASFETLVNDGIGHSEAEKIKKALVVQDVVDYETANYDLPRWYKTVKNVPIAPHAEPRPSYVYKEPKAVPHVPSFRPPSYTYRKSKVVHRDEYIYRTPKKLAAMPLMAPAPKPAVEAIEEIEAAAKPAPTAVIEMPPALPVSVEMPKEIAKEGVARERVLTVAAYEKTAMYGVLLGFFLALVVAESLVYAQRPELGLFLHAMIILAILMYASLINRRQRAFSGLLASLTLIPFIRILTLSLPLLPFTQIQRYFIVSLLLIIGAFIFIYVQSLWREDVGLELGTRRHAPLQAAIILVGIAFGFIQYTLVQTAPLIQTLTPETIIAPAIILGISAFSEELVFRGLVLHNSTVLLGSHGAVFFTALLFAAMHIGTSQFFAAVFALVLGVLFGYTVLKTKSLVGVTFAHAAFNVGILLVFPFIL